MDFEDREEIEEGLPKGHSSFLHFSFSGAIGFVYFHFHTSGTLEVWQLLVCILASGTGSLLIFLPFLLERSLQLYLHNSNRKDDELFRKVYFDLKEVRNDLESLAVRIDKVPTLVDKIVSESVNDTNPAEEISNELKKLQNEIELKLARLEEIAVQNSFPMIPIQPLSRVWNRYQSEKRYKTCPKIRKNSRFNWKNDRIS